MNQSLKRGLLVAGSLALTVVAIKQYQRACTNNGTSISDSAELDRRPSVDQQHDEAEVGLTQLDSIQRSDWQANGFPQTHAELEQLENE